MIFDGSPLSINDSVYDMAYGSGHIIEINEGVGSFRVAFGPRSYTYLPTGIGMFPRKTLFWREPLGGFVPPKDTVKWDMFVKMRKSIVDTLGLS